MRIGAQSLLVGSLLLSAGCLGSAQTSSGGGGGGSGGGGSSTKPSPNDGVTKFACDAKQQPAMDSLRALTNLQYTNTINDLLTSAIGASGAAAVMADSGVQSALTEIPPQSPALPPAMPATANQSAATTAVIAAANTDQSTFIDGGWFRGDQTIETARIAAFYGVGQAVATAVTNNYLSQLAGSCATGSAGGTNASCVTSFIQKFGARALRRAITSDDVTQYTAFFNLNGPDSTQTNPAAPAYADLVTGLLNAPELLYFVEHGDTTQPVANLNGVYALSSYELASRLSYHVWDTLPDDELWGHAVDGSILQEATYASEVKRVFADPRAQATLHEFFTDYFDARPIGGPRGTGGLNYHNFADTQLLATPTFKAFAGADLPTDGNLFPDMLAESIGLADYYSWTTPGTLHDLLTSSKSFAQTADVAHIYGVAVWDGKSEPPDLPNERPGILARAMFTAYGIDTSPILKGVYIRRTILCDSIGPPPAAAAGTSVDTTNFETTRQAVEQVTSGAACSGCHTNLINPLGFASENFDGLGRFRTMETLFNTDGTVATMLPVNTAVTPWVMQLDAKTTAPDLAGVVSIAEASGKPQACFARNYFRYAFGRYEDTTVDACTLEPMRTSLDNNGSLQSFWQSVVNTPGFKQRTFQ